MGGRASRSKGKRGEYLVRDYFRSLGMWAERVPSSGAAQGFPGDVKVIAKDGSSFLVEVKLRQESFKSIYKAYLDASYAGKLCLITPKHLVTICDSYDNLYGHTLYECVPALKRLLNRLDTLQKVVKGSDILIIKDNNKPLLFLRFIPVFSGVE